MELHLHVLGLASLMAIAAVAVQGVKYEVINNATGTPGGIRFDRDIGADYAKQLLTHASSFVWKVFHQAENETRKISRVVLIVEPKMEGVAQTSGGEIHLNSGYIAGYEGDVRREITGLLYREVTRVWQWDGNRTAPAALLDGVADYVRMEAGYPPVSTSRLGGGEGEGKGKGWDQQGPNVTARFLQYCNGLNKNGTFVADMNNFMKDGYTDLLFVRLLGQTGYELWQAYQSVHGK